MSGYTGFESVHRGFPVCRVHIFTRLLITSGHRGQHFPRMGAMTIAAKFQPINFKVLFVIVNGIFKIAAMHNRIYLYQQYWLLESNYFLHQWSAKVKFYSRIVV
jgi:hypothetical protein